MQAGCGQQAGEHPHRLAETQAGLGWLARVRLLESLIPEAGQCPLLARNPEGLGPVAGLRGSGFSPGAIVPFPQLAVPLPRAPGTGGTWPVRGQASRSCGPCRCPRCPTGAWCDGPACRLPLQTRPRPHDPTPEATPGFPCHLTAGTLSSELTLS